MQKSCCICKTEHIMLYSHRLHVGWCAEHMPNKQDYDLALAKQEEIRVKTRPKYAKPK